MTFASVLWRRASWWALLPLSLVSCGDTARSTNLETAGFHVDYGVLVDGTNEPSAIAVFRDRGADGSYLDLVDGDRVAVDGKPMDRISSFGALPGFDGVTEAYEASVSGPGPHLFTFSRAGEPDVTHSIDTPLPVLTERAKISVDYSDDIRFVWPPIQGARIRVTVSGVTDPECPAPSLVDDAPDTGQLDLEASVFEPEDLRACGFELHIERTLVRPLGQPFLGGSLRQVTVSYADVEVR